MAFKTMDGKEIRVPGRAVEAGKQRAGALGKLDAMAFSKYKGLGQEERLMLMKDAFAKKGNDVKAKAYCERIAMLEKYYDLTGEFFYKHEYGYTTYTGEKIRYVGRLLHAGELAKEYGLQEREPNYAAKKALKAAISEFESHASYYEKHMPSKSELRRQAKSWGPTEMSDWCSDGWELVNEAYRAAEHLGKKAEKEAAKIHWKYLVTWWFRDTIHDTGYPCYLEAAKLAIKHGLAAELKKTIELACDAYSEEKGNAKMPHYHIRMLEKMLEVGLPREFFDNATRCAGVSEKAGMEKVLKLAAKKLEEQAKTKQ